MWQQCPKRNAHDQDPNDRRKKTAFAGRFFCKPQLAAETWCISRTTLAWGHHIKLCLSLQRYFALVDLRRLKASVVNFGVQKRYQ
jgi:hypothetical protein